LPLSLLSSCSSSCLYDPSWSPSPKRSFNSYFLSMVDLVIAFTVVQPYFPSSLLLLLIMSWWWLFGEHCPSRLCLCLLIIFVVLLILLIAAVVLVVVLIGFPILVFVLFSCSSRFCSTSLSLWPRSSRLVITVGPLGHHLSFSWCCTLWWCSSRPFYQAVLARLVFDALVLLVVVLIALFVPMFVIFLFVVLQVTLSDVITILSSMTLSMLALLMPSYSCSL
jgi:hypothetical protein